MSIGHSSFGCPPAKKLPGWAPSKSTSDAGVTILETLLMITLLFLLLFGIMESSILLFNQAVLTNASREGARFGAMFDVDPAANFSYSPKSDNEIIQRVLDYSSSHLVNFSSFSPPTVQLSPDWASRQAGASGTPLQVTVRYQFRFLLLPNLASEVVGATTLGADTLMRME
jgi:Flp pilus assembly protein TadG